MVVNRKRHSQRAIKRAFCELLLKQPIQKVFVKNICKRADYSTMAFYASYQDKYDLAHQIIQDEVDEHLAYNTAVVETLGGQEPDQQQIEGLFQRTAQHFFERVKDRPLIYQCIFENRLVDDGIQAYAELNTKGLQKKVDFVSQANDQTGSYQQFFMEQTTIMLLNAAKYWMKKGFNLSAKDLAALYTHYRFSGSSDLQLNTATSRIRIALLWILCMIEDDFDAKANFEGLQWSAKISGWFDVTVWERTISVDDFFPWLRL